MLFCFFYEGRLERTNGKALVFPAVQGYPIRLMTLFGHACTWGEQLWDYNHPTSSYADYIVPTDLRRRNRRLNVHNAKIIAT